MLIESEQFATQRSLDSILVDEKFARSPQMSAFLRYVVNESLHGRADRIKAYTVAVDALGKNNAFDPQNDPSVRVLAKRLRTCLDDYNERAVNPEIIIELFAGSYRPVFSKPMASGEKQVLNQELPAGIAALRRLAINTVPVTRAPMDSLPVVAPVGMASANDEETKQVSAADNSTLASKLLHSAQVRSMLSGVFVLIAVLASANVEHVLA